MRGCPRRVGAVAHRHPMSAARTNNWPNAHHQTRCPIELLPWTDCGTLLKVLLRSKSSSLGPLPLISPRRQRRIPLGLRGTPDERGAVAAGCSGAYGRICGVHDETLRRGALNETLYREINEIIAGGQRQVKSGQDIRFRCECVRPDCNEPVEVPRPIRVCARASGLVHPPSGPRDARGRAGRLHDQPLCSGGEEGRRRRGRRGH